MSTKHPSSLEYLLKFKYDLTDLSSSRQVMIAALLPRAPMYRNAPEEESVSIMTYANARWSGLEMTAPSTLVHLSTTAQVSTVCIFLL